MTESVSKKLRNVIQIDEMQIQQHPEESLPASQPYISRMRQSAGVVGFGVPAAVLS